MRAAVLVASMIVPLTAAAGPFHDVIVQPPRHAPAGTSHFTSVSRVIYLNPCLPDGCTVGPGFDDSTTDHSSIPNRTSHLAAYPWGQDSWNNLVQCVKDMYGPFDVTVTDVDPGSAPHFELMVAGNGNDIGVPGAGGVAPFVPCDGQLEDNVISFVFAAQTQNADFLCWAAAQETSHVFGLDHELNAKDPMTYLSPPTKKPGFQDTASNCGEDTPRDCWCGGPTQNSYQYLMDTFGPSHLDPPSLTITSPADGAWVKPGFTVRAAAVTQLSVKTGDLQLDGATMSSVSQPPLVFTAPTTLPGGDHTITVVATDAGARQFSGQATVHVTAACGADNHCTGAFKCLGGYCLPGADTSGGLGAECVDSSECITGSCGTDGNSHLCTGACDSGDRCPSGFDCRSAGTTSVCWPATSSGGCATSGDGSPAFVLGGLGALALLVRRRHA
jgi:uncharacterized protein (TIGR03382 family)